MDITSKNYEAPELVDLGTLADLTEGVETNGADMITTGAPPVS